MSAISPEEQRDIVNALLTMGLAKEQQHGRIARLSGGVSCDVYEVDIGRQKICVKRALAKLRVKADWTAPPERTVAEVAWMRLVDKIAPGHAPKVFGVDTTRHMFAMEFFPPEGFPVWKDWLAKGDINIDFAGKVGTALSFIHAATAGRADIAKSFGYDAQFRALRLEPFFYYVADRHADVSAQLHKLARNVATSRIALMHGDVSPKNILQGTKRPVFLDAETTCYGDPAFDLAFCLAHLLLKCVWHPKWMDRYQQSFAQLRTAYLAGVSWEGADAFERRAANLLPALLLARVDGKSPADYLTAEAKQMFVRKESIAMLKRNPGSLAGVAAQWRKMINASWLGE
ncbi:MAG TPA: aminoglycoside phosphotransferase family protein [Rhizomicrobium sp.]|nr:aminoglycoside phosphotransferase family protein [Rhizomicrobium sp.]